MGFERKKYIYDSYLSEYTTTVRSCTQVSDSYEITLESTIFYPDMVGGQPRDYGTINGLEVKNVIERDDEVIHIVDEPIEGEARLHIDMDRRMDIMQQHTGQHILSSSFAKLYNAKTIGFHLSKDYTTIDLDIDYFSDDMIIRAEHYANDIIYSNIKIETEILVREEALKENLRKITVDDEIIRLVKIGDKDNVACCGTHLSMTGEVGIVKVMKHEKYKNGTRIEFVCGKRALDDYINKNNCVYRLSNEFSCHVSKLEESINKLKNEDNNKSKKINTIQAQLNQYKAADYANSYIAKDDLKFVYKTEDDCDTKQLRVIAGLITENDNFVCCLLGKAENSFTLLIAKSKNVKLDLKALFKKCSESADIKGGGNEYMLQGSGNNVLNIKNIEVIMNEIMH